MPRIGESIRKPSPEPSVQSRAATLKAELEALRQLESVLALIRGLKRRHPELVEEFSRQLHAAIDEEPSEQEPETEVTSPPEEPEPSDGEYGVEKLVSWFRSRNNEPATVREMAKAIGRSEKTVKSILYLRHKGKFVAVEKRGRNNRAYYRMAEV